MAREYLHQLPQDDRPVEERFAEYRDAQIMRSLTGWQHHRMKELPWIGITPRKTMTGPMMYEFAGIGIEQEDEFWSAW